MGYNTTVVILNDALDSIEKDPTFGTRLAKEIRQSSFRPDTPNGVSAAGFGNAAMVVETHSSADEVAVIVGKNTGHVQSPDEIVRARAEGYERGREDERKKKKERQTRERKRIDELENILRVGGALLRAERVSLGVPVVDMVEPRTGEAPRMIPAFSPLSAHFEAEREARAHEAPHTSLEESVTVLEMLNLLDESIRDRLMHNGAGHERCLANVAKNLRKAYERETRTDKAMPTIEVGTHIREAVSGVVIALETVTYETTGKSETYAKIDWGGHWNRRPVSCLVPAHEQRVDYARNEAAGRVVAAWLSEIEEDDADVGNITDDQIRDLVSRIYASRDSDSAPAPKGGE